MIIAKHQIIQLKSSKTANNLGGKFMKKTFLSIIMTFVFMFVCIPYTANAANEGGMITSVNTDYFEDGSYYKTTIITYGSRAAMTRSGAKKVEYVNSNDVLQWTYTLYGTFSYDGSSATCTAVSDSYSISNNSWHIDSHSCWKSGNTAYGTVTMNYKILGITTDTITKNVSLSCSANGTLS